MTDQPVRRQSMSRQSVSRQSMSRRMVLAATAGLAGAAAFARHTRIGARQRQARDAGERDHQPAARAGCAANRRSTPTPTSSSSTRPLIALRRTQGAIYRLWTGALWAEGPAWSSQGQYLVFSDVSGNVQYRYIWDDGRVTAFRRPSYNTNGNSFDYQGRQLSCEDFYRRVVRWEHDGAMTVIADSYQGKPLNSPNDLVPHPDGSIWFTDPPYGDSIPEGHPDEAGGPTNPQGMLNPRSAPRTPARSAGKQARIADRRLSLGPERQARSGDHRGAIARPQRHLLFARPQDALRDQHRQRPRRHRTGRQTGDLCLRHAGDKARQPARVHRHDRRRRQMRPRRHARRCRRQSVVRLECAARLCRRSGVQPGGQADRPHPACPKYAPTSPLAAPSATGCSWPRASRSTCWKWRSRVRRRADPPPELATAGASAHA